MGTLSGWFFTAMVTTTLQKITMPVNTATMIIQRLLLVVFGVEVVIVLQSVIGAEEFHFTFHAGSVGAVFTDAKADFDRLREIFLR
jgi:uncharacterized membrane protein YccF (DUF307 family)